MYETTIMPKKMAAMPELYHAIAMMLNVAMLKANAGNIG